MILVEEDSERLWAFLKWTVNKFAPRYAMPGLTFPHWPLGSRGICHAALMQKAAWCRRFLPSGTMGALSNNPYPTFIGHVRDIASKVASHLPRLLKCHGSSSGHYEPFYWGGLHRPFFFWWVRCIYVVLNRFDVGSQKFRRKWLVTITSTIFGSCVAADMYINNIKL